jgi:hypothetical protein
MYARFTDRARKVIQLANEEAQRYNHEYIGTEHILLGLAKEGSGVAANVLKNFGAELSTLRRETEKFVQQGPDVVTMPKLPLTPRAKKVIENAIEEARNLNHNYVSTEHLLLGLLREEEGVAAQVLQNLGLRLADVRTEVLSLLGTSIHELSLAETLGTSTKSAREFDIFVPLVRADGSPLQPERIARLQDRLQSHFPLCFSFYQSAYGTVGEVPCHGDVLVLRVIGPQPEASKTILQQFKEELKTELRLPDVLIIGRKVRIL